MRLIRGGWPVPARIEFDTTTAHWSVTIDGVTLPSSTDWIEAEVGQVWCFADRSDEAEYRYLNELREWALAHEPGHPAANPRRPIRHNDLPPLPLPPQRNRL